MTPTGPRAHRRLLTALAIAAITLSCSKKGGVSLPVQPPAATATLTGVLLSATSGLPLAGVTLSSTPAAGGPATSNSSGLFTLRVPANSPVAVAVGLPGYASHPIAVNLATGTTGVTALVLAPVGASQTVFTGTGGKVTHGAAKTAITFPPGFVTGTSSVQVGVTALDPTTQQALAMPGTFAALTRLGAAVSLEPAALAEITVGDGAGLSFPLAQPGILEMHLPSSLAADPRYDLGSLVPCLRYDEPSGLWKVFADGVVVLSSVDAQPAVRVTVDHLSWFAAGFLNGSNSCVTGVVTASGAPIAGAEVRAYPGGSDVSKADGTFRVAAPPQASVQLLGVRSSSGTLRVGGSVATTLALGKGCVNQDIALQGGGPAPTFTLSAQLMRGRDAFRVLRDEVRVKIVTNTTPSPTPLDGALVQLRDGIAWKTLPRLSAGVYGIISGLPGPFSLLPGTIYELRVDLEPDGVFDGSAQVQMPGRPTITAPVRDEQVFASFTAGWSDPEISLAGYSARYIGAFESGSFGTFPARFALDSPAGSTVIGTGIGQSQYGFTNDPLLAGPYTFRLWATNGPVRYPVGTSLIFAQPNLVTTRITGWFSAIAQADSIPLTSLGDGSPRPAAARRVRSAGTVAAH